MKNNYSFIRFNDSMALPDGVYNGRYNKEPSIIRIKNRLPVWVTFIGFIKHFEGQDEVRSSAIYDPKGITHSNVELLLPAQEIIL